MTNPNGHLLTAQEASTFIRTTIDDPIMLQLLSPVDMFVQRATGRIWTEDATIHPLAKVAAGILIVQWYDNPAGLVTSEQEMPHGLTSALAQLEAEALRYRKYEFRGLASSGYIALEPGKFGDQVILLQGVYGVFGDQSANFESALRYDYVLHQLTSDDCFWNRYVIVLKSPGDDVYP